METNNKMQIKNWCEFINKQNDGSYNTNDLNNRYVKLFTNYSIIITVSVSDLGSLEKYSKLMSLLWKFNAKNARKSVISDKIMEIIRTAYINNDIDNQSVTKNH